MRRLCGSCHCGAVVFEFETTAPVPFMRCYCSICRKTAGGGGYAINILGTAASLRISRGAEAVQSYRAVKDKSLPKAEQTLCQDRFFCPTCASYLWAHSDDWPQWIYPYASAVDSELPPPASAACIMLDHAPAWADPRHTSTGGAELFGEYPPFSLEQWHRDHDAAV
ncbi:hypothetical protein LPJ61_002115 [Coemansia biformis]|uniref:CENP-V/GFA domain-containing protein n=1 Tax=Coemansia biformis TaxID=1286918 RepID=A0A9W7Y8W1_9FUNG|nr:hypothetical protein LPJ61_002115 [Coemansia biformis]